MATFKNRLPARQEIVYAFAVCVFPIHFWSVVNFLLQAKGIALRLNTWDFIGVIAYVLAFALFESLLAFLVILALALVTPRGLFGDKFVALTSIIIFMASIWFIFLHYNDLIGQRQLAALTLWAITYFLIVCGLFYLVHHSSGLKKWLDALATRLVVLAVLYVAIDVVSLVVVLVRNL